MDRPFWYGQSSSRSLESPASVFQVGSAFSSGPLTMDGLLCLPQRPSHKSVFNKIYVGARVASETSRHFSDCGNIKIFKACGWGPWEEDTEQPLILRRKWTYQSSLILCGYNKISTWKRIGLNKLIRDRLHLEMIMLSQAKAQQKCSNLCKCKKHDKGFLGCT